MPLAINSTKYRLPAGQYVPEELSKDMIVLHYTAGTTASGAFQSWLPTPERVGTALIVDLDTTIYEVFPAAAWAWHLGVKNTRKHDQRSIGIEIVNVGPLKRQGDNLMWWPENYGRYKYCSIAETDRYVKSDFRGFQYHATFKPAQVTAVGQLVEDLCQRFNIAPVLPTPTQRVVCDPAIYTAFKGIATHQMFLKDKSDIGPAWPWEALA